MKKLSEVKWDAFPIDDIFEISSGHDIYEKERTSGNHPYVTATANQNGIGYFVGNKNETLEKNCISVNRNGSVGYAFYHPYFALYGNDTRKLKPKCAGHYAKFFLARMITAQKDKFGYGLKLGTDRLKKQKIMLPANKNGQPDYEYMEQYMKAIEKKLLERYQHYLADIKHNSLTDKKLTNRGKIEWHEFKIGDIFEVKRPVARNKDDYQNGDIFFVASGAANNGVMKCCTPNNGEDLDKGNCLTVSPVDGTCFYQPVDFLGRGGAGSSVLLLYHKTIVLNRHIGLFLARAINVATSQYSYGRMANSESIRRTKFQIPIKENGQPDYEYMEQYMKAIEHRLINRYIEKRLKTL